jgi:carbon monoxide dehydrogenase subunit G
MPEIHFVEICDAPVEVAFDYLDNYRNVTDCWHGMSSYTPVGELDHGLGSVFQAVSKLGPSTVKSTVKTVGWEKNVRLAYKSIAGMDTSTAFDFTAIDETHSRVDFRVEFTLPGGIAGKALAMTLEPVVNATAKSTVQNLAREIAAYHAAGLQGSDNSPK